MSRVSHHPKNSFFSDEAEDMEKNHTERTEPWTRTPPTGL